MKAHKKLNPKLFVGKTIIKMDTNHCNCVTFYLSDGTAVKLEAVLGEFTIPTILQVRPEHE